MHKILNVLPIILIICMILTNIFAADIGQIDDILNTNDNPGLPGFESKIGNIWATIVTVVQVLAVAAVVFAGLRYMFASADAKADIKKSMGILFVGAILVFCATTIIKVIANVANNVM